MSDPSPISIDVVLDTFCPLCSKRLNNFARAKQHISKKHEGCYLCPVCLVQFRNKKKLFYHNKADHPYCGDCNIRFKLKDDFYLHNLVFHFKDMIVTNKMLYGTTNLEKRCKVCNLKLESRSYAYIHLKYAHALLRPFFTRLHSN